MNSLCFIERHDKEIIARFSVDSEGVDYKYHFLTLDDKYKIYDKEKKYIKLEKQIFITLTEYEIDNIEILRNWWDLLVEIGFVYKTKKIAFG